MHVINVKIKYENLIFTFKTHVFFLITNFEISFRKMKNWGTIRISSKTVNVLEIIVLVNPYL